MTTLPRKPGFGPMGYKTFYRLENSAGEVIAEGNYLRQFIQLVETLGYEMVGQTERGFYTVDTPNGPVTHPHPDLPQPIFDGVDGPISENFGRRAYKTKPTNEEVTQ